jgi:hypothetical protein
MSRVGLRSVLLIAVALLLCSPAVAQDINAQMKERLVGQPLYLRGFWMGSKLRFDGSGNLLGKAEIGPLTLSGIDVHSVSVSGDEMQIKGDRVALVAGADGRLQRRTPYSTTLITSSLRRGDGNKFKAKQEMTLLIHADASGSFDTALGIVLANGLVELATSVPPYWSCYASGFFAKEVALDQAQKITDACARQRGFATDYSAEGFMPPQEPPNLPIQWTNEAGELHLEGTSSLHMTIGPHGVPLRFQIVRAAGAGMDEMLMQAVAERRFIPATKDRKPVPADYEKSLTFTAR